MSVSSIITSLTNQVSTTRGAEWSELNYIYDLDNNNFRDNDKRYGVGALSGTTVQGITQAVTIDFDFFITLARRYANRSNDTKEREVIADIYDQFELINENIFQKKLSNGTILVVQSLSYDAPEQIQANTIAITMNVTIKYKNLTV